jgi:hypothetical protein
MCPVSVTTRGIDMFRFLAALVLLCAWVAPSHASVSCARNSENPDGYTPSASQFWCQQSYHFANTYTWSVSPSFAYAAPTSFAQWQRTVLCDPGHPSLAPVNGQQVVKLATVSVTYRYQTYTAQGLTWMTVSESYPITCTGPAPAPDGNGIVWIWVEYPYIWGGDNWYCGIAYWEGGWCGPEYFPAYW